jgi:hypothetical protein
MVFRSIHFPEIRPKKPISAEKFGRFSMLLIFLNIFGRINNLMSFSKNSDKIKNFQKSKIFFEKKFCTK